MNRITEQQELLVKSSYTLNGSIRETALETGHSRDVVRRVVRGMTLGGDQPATMPTDPSGINYEVLAATVAALLRKGPVNEGPPDAPQGEESKVIAPAAPGLYLAPRIYEKTVVLSDLHYPYPNEAAVSAALQFISDCKPGLIIINGDLFDAYLISRYQKSPEQLNHHLQREFDLAKPFIREIDRFGSDVVFILGNHEARVDALKAENPGLSRLRALEWHNMAELPKRWQILPQHSVYRLGGLDIHHGDRMQGPGAVHVAARMLARVKRSSLFGHFHRDQAHYEPDGYGKLRGSFASGHMCNEHEAAKYCVLNNWATGFRSVDADPETEFYEVRSHLVHDGKLRANGITYRG